MKLTPSLLLHTTSAEILPMKITNWVDHLASFLSKIRWWSSDPPMQLIVTIN